MLLFWKCHLLKRSIFVSVAGDTNKSLGPTAARDTLMGHLVCGPLNPSFSLSTPGSCSVVCWGSLEGSATSADCSFCKPPLCRFFPPAYPSKYVPLNPICSCIESHQTQWLPTKYSKKAAPGPFWWVGRGGSVWASPMERADSSPGPETQLGCSSDQQRVTGGKKDQITFVQPPPPCFPALLKRKHVVLSLFFLFCTQSLLWASELNQALQAQVS